MNAHLAVLNAKESLLIAEMNVTAATLNAEYSPSRGADIVVIMALSERDRAREALATAEANLLVAGLA